MVFVDSPLDALPANSKSGGNARPSGTARANKNSSGTREKRNGTTQNPSSQAGAAGTAAEAKKPPAHLVADLIKIKVLRAGDRSEVSQVETEGRVEFEQAAAEPDGDSVLVRGNALLLQRVENKNYLQVSGRPAHVRLNSMSLDGDRVNIDQPTNTAWVDGKGLMKLISDSSFEGKKLATPSELTIVWGTRMFFDGMVAEFGGGVEAKQSTSQLRCQSLVVRLTEPMDLAAPKSDGSGAAKIKDLDCRDAVVLQNTVMADGRLEKHEHLEAGRLEFSNETGQMVAWGPGLVRTYSRGESEFGPAKQEPADGRAPAKPPKRDTDQMLLTDVHFANRLDADRSNQIAKFYGHIEVIRSPVADENEVVNPDSLPAKSLRIACGELEMGTKRGPDDRPYNIMVASDNVYVESDVFSGRGDRVSYNQLHERIIFESRSDTFATFYRVLRRGDRPDLWTARKIMYEVRKAEVKVEGAIAVDLQEREADRRDSPKNSTKR
jgi:hypothetical protein